MIEVYIWMPRGSNWGHAGMYVHNEANNERRYISFWPRVIACAGEHPWSGCAPGANDFWNDCRLEGVAPTHDFMLNYGGRDDFSEAGILAGWARMKREQPLYAALRHNCCTVVANLVLNDGGGRAHTTFPAPLVWTPDSLRRLMSTFPLRIRCAERLYIEPPPADVRT